MSRVTSVARHGACGAQCTECIEKRFLCPCVLLVLLVLLIAVLSTGEIPAVNQSQSMSSALTDACLKAKTKTEGLVRNLLAPPPLQFFDRLLEISQLGMRPCWVQVSARPKCITMRICPSKRSLLHHCARLRNGPVQQPRCFLFSASKPKINRQ